jgi:Peptidase family M28
VAGYLQFISKNKQRLTSFLLLTCFITSVSKGQTINDTISAKEVARIMTVLASDSLKGRGNLQPALLEAGKFIGREFKKDGLLPLPDFPSYFLPFRPTGGRRNETTDELLWNGIKIPAENYIYLSINPGNYEGKTLKDFSVIKLDTSFSENTLNELPSGTNALIIWSNKKPGKKKDFFPDKFKMKATGLGQDVLLVYADEKPSSILLTANQRYYSMLEYNVVGIIPGRSQAGELVVFSAHYDHEGVFPTRKNEDSILNGANDNASGTTAMLMLANYFAKRNDNERTLVFCAFAGEELGLTGSQEFVRYIDLNRITAGINIEMIGVPQFGKRKVFITGERYSSLPSILSSGLEQNGIKVIREPDETKELFKRSDNYSFARKGVPFHSIMASDDDDRCYHQPCDELGRIDAENMTAIIRAIAASVKTLVSGKVTRRQVQGF